jgi:hypothetical protein
MDDDELREVEFDESRATLRRTGAYRDRGAEVVSMAPSARES